jgi:hypothetical protein
MTNMKQKILGAQFVLGVLMGASASGEQPVAMNVSAPEFEKADEWINSKPLKLKDLRGQVVVVHFWTFG